MKAETDTRCLQKTGGAVCGGTLFSIAPSRLEAFLEHRVYQCDRCGIKWKFPDAAVEPKAPAHASLKAKGVRR